MTQFSKMTPILNPTPEDIKNYYEENNIPAWDNPYFEKYVGPIKGNVPEPERTYDEEVTFTYGESSEKNKEQFEPILHKYRQPEKRSEYVTDPNFTPSTEQSIINEIRNLEITDSDKNYLIKLAKRESNFDPNVINRFGYQGLYQFGDLALKDVGFNREDLSDTLKQHQAALALAQTNERRLKTILDKYENKTFKGIHITKNGIRAAAHLLGAATVKDWFNGTTNTKFAKRGFVDGNGTHITEYLKMFV